MPIKKNAIWFHGGSSFIAQEVAVIDLLKQYKNLVLTEEDSVVVGFSTGAIMTFAINAAYSDPAALPWEELKNLLFNLENSDIYIENPDGEGAVYDTTPLRNSLTAWVEERAGYKYMRDFPFGSAILTASKLEGEASENGTYWLNNVTAVEPQGDLADAAQIREHQSNLNVVDMLMDSTAIPDFFPAQKLRYQEGDGEAYITDGTNPVEFLDGGTYGTFQGFQHFCDNHGDKFENLYLVFPDFITIGGGRSRDVAEIMFNRFINDLKAYNDTNQLAQNIYKCLPQIQGLFNPMDFTKEEEMYNKTMEWGRNDQNAIAVDVYA